MNAVKRDKSNIDILFLLALFGVFLISALFVILFGARIYKKTVAGAEENFIKRTAVAYISEKVQKNDSENCVSAVTADGVSALRLATRVQTDTYYTYLYFFDGCLREITLKATTEFHKADGTPVLALNDFSVRQKGTLFSFCITDRTGSSTEFCIAPRCAVEQGGASHE